MQTDRAEFEERLRWALLCGVLASLAALWFSPRHLWTQPSLAWLFQAVGLGLPGAFLGALLGFLAAPTWWFRSAGQSGLSLARYRKAPRGAPPYVKPLDPFIKTTHGVAVIALLGVAACFSSTLWVWLVLPFVAAGYRVWLVDAASGAYRVITFFGLQWEDRPALGKPDAPVGERRDDGAVYAARIRIAKLGGFGAYLLGVGLLLWILGAHGKLDQTPVLSALYCALPLAFVGYHVSYALLPRGATSARVPVITHARNPLVKVESPSDTGRQLGCGVLLLFFPPVWMMLLGLALVPLVPFIYYYHQTQWPWTGLLGALFVVGGLACFAKPNLSVWHELDVVTLQVYKHTLFGGYAFYDTVEPGTHVRSITVAPKSGSLPFVPVAVLNTGTQVPIGPPQQDQTLALAVAIQIARAALLPCDLNDWPRVLAPANPPSEQPPLS